MPVEKKTTRSAKEDDEAGAEQERAPRPRKNVIFVGHDPERSGLGREVEPVRGFVSSGMLPPFEIDKTPAEQKGGFALTPEQARVLIDTVPGYKSYEAEGEED